MRFRRSFLPGKESILPDRGQRPPTASLSPGGDEEAPHHTFEQGRAKSACDESSEKNELAAKFPS
jgi:hypothetical protein